MAFNRRIKTLIEQQENFSTELFYQSILKIEIINKKIEKLLKRFEYAYK